jgi:hypothetical protein
MAPSRIFVISGIAVALGEAALAVAARGTGLMPYLAACAAVTVVLAFAGARLLGPEDDAGGDDSDGGPGGPPRGPDGDPSPDPPWWPEFEAAFRAHTRDRTPV